MQMQFANLEPTNRICYPNCEVFVNGRLPLYIYLDQQLLLRNNRRIPTGNLVFTVAARAFDKIQIRFTYYRIILLCYSETLFINLSGT